MHLGRKQLTLIDLPPASGHLCGAARPPPAATRLQTGAILDLGTRSRTSSPAAWDR